jgi:hypothetical protein
MAMSAHILYFGPDETARTMATPGADAAVAHRLCQWRRDADRQPEPQHRGSNSFGHPERTAVITFVGQPRTVLRLQCAAAGECGGQLILMNHDGSVVGRFQTMDVGSWFFAD